MDEISSAARAMDGSRETVHGIFAARDVVVLNLRAWRATWPRRRDLGELLLAYHRDRLLDERRVHCSNGVRNETNRDVLAHPLTLDRQRRVFHRRQISVGEDRHRAINLRRRLATIHARTIAKRTRRG